MPDVTNAQILQEGKMLMTPISEQKQDVIIPYHADEFIPDIQWCCQNETGAASKLIVDISVCCTARTGTDTQPDR